MKKRKEIRPMSKLNKKNVEDLQVKGKKVLVRVDFNVPMKEGVITNDNRIVAALPTINKLVENGAKIVLCSHLGKPKNGPEDKFSLKAAAERLAQLVDTKVIFAKDDTVVGENAKKAVAEYLNNKPGDVDFNDAAALQVHLGILKRIELQDKMDIVETEVHIMRLGTIAIATSPFELFLDFGNQIKARSNAEQTFLIQLACGTEGYLPTEKAEKGGHYSASVSSGCAGHAGGDLLVRKTLSEINNLF